MKTCKVETIRGRCNQLPAFSEPDMTRTITVKNKNDGLTSGIYNPCIREDICYYHKKKLNGDFDTVPRMFRERHRLNGIE